MGALNNPFAVGASGGQDQLPLLAALANLANLGGVPGGLSFSDLGFDVDRDDAGLPVEAIDNAPPPAPGPVGTPAPSPVRRPTGSNNVSSGADNPNRPPRATPPPPAQASQSPQGFDGPPSTNAPSAPPTITRLPDGRQPDATFNPPGGGTGISLPIGGPGTVVDTVGQDFIDAFSNTSGRGANQLQPSAPLRLPDSRNVDPAPRRPITPSVPTQAGPQVETSGMPPGTAFTPGIAGGQGQGPLNTDGPGAGMSDEERRRIKQKMNQGSGIRASAPGLDPKIFQMPGSQGISARAPARTPEVFRPGAGQDSAPSIRRPRRPISRSRFNQNGGIANALAPFLGFQQ